MLAHRAKADAFFTKLMPHFEMELEMQVQDFDCYRYLINAYEDICEPFSDYSAKYAKVLAHACNTYDDFQLAGLVNQMQAQC